MQSERVLSIQLTIRLEFNTNICSSEENKNKSIVADIKLNRSR